jgi:hypothetical protein
VGLAHGIPPADMFDQPDDVIVTLADIFEARHREALAAKAKGRTTTRPRRGRKGR